MNLKKRQRLSKMIKFVKNMKFVIAISDAGSPGMKFVSVNGSRQFTIPEARKVVEDTLRMIKEIRND